MLKSVVFATVFFGMVAAQAKSVDCKNPDNLILVECQMDSVKASLTQNALYKAAQAEALRRLAPRWTEGETVTISPARCGKTAVIRVKDSSDLRASSQCTITYKQDLEGAKPYTGKVTLNVRAHIENEAESYFAQIDSVELK